MTDKPEVRITKTLAAMARGAPLARIERLCESQKTVTCSVLAQMVEEAQDINTDYALTFKYGHEASRAADKARIAALERERNEFSMHKMASRQCVGIPASVGVCEPVEGFAERPQDLAPVMREMALMIEVDKARIAELVEALEGMCEASHWDSTKSIDAARKTAEEALAQQGKEGGA